jgi:hypothetical protein
MKWVRVIQLLAVGIAILAVAQLTPASAAPPDQSGTEQQATCNKVTNFIFPDIPLSAQRGPKFVRMVAKVDKDCNVAVSEQTVLTDIPAEFLPSKGLSSAASTTVTDEVHIWEQDVAGYLTNDLDTYQIWSYNGSSVNLLNGGNKPPQTCGICTWWHVNSGPSFTHGYYSSSHGYANGTVSWYCNWGPPGFCPGGNWQYRITYYTWLHLYGNGYSTANGTSYSGQVIPGGGIYYTHIQY